MVFFYHVQTMDSPREGKESASLEEKKRVSFKELYSNAIDKHSECELDDRRCLRSDLNRILDDFFAKEREESVDPKNYIVDHQDLDCFLSDIDDNPGMSYLPDALKHVVIPLYVHHFPTHVGSMLFKFFFQPDMVKTILDLAKKQGLEKIEEFFPGNVKTYDICREFTSIFPEEESDFCEGEKVFKSVRDQPSYRLMELMIPLLKTLQDQDEK